MRGFRSWDVFYTGFLLAAFLWCIHFPPTEAIGSLAVLSIPEKPAEGQNVTLSLLNVTGSIRQFDWFRGVVTEGGSRIFTYFTGENKRPQRNGVRFTQREFGYPNGSLLLTGVQQNDTGPYSVVVYIRPKGTFKGTTVLQLAGSASATTTPPPPPPMTTHPAKVPSTLGWIVAGVLVGILLAGALGAILVYRFVLQKAEPGTGVRLDPRVIRPPAFKRDDTEPIYEVMDSPVESPRMEGKPVHPIPEPLPPLAGTCPSLDSNYTDLLRRAESIYSEIKR